MKTDPSLPEFVIARVFDAPRDAVYAMWTEPKHMTGWWGPRVFSTPICELAVRQGGTYRVVMRGMDGTDYPVTGVYREVVKNERLVMTMDCTGHPDAWHDLVKPDRTKDETNPAGEMVLTVTFKEAGGLTGQTIHIRFKSVAIRDAMLKMGMNEGWSESLNRLEELVSVKR